MTHDTGHARGHPHAGHVTCAAPLLPCPAAPPPPSCTHTHTATARACVARCHRAPMTVCLTMRACASAPPPPPRLMPPVQALYREAADAVCSRGAHNRTARGHALLLPLHRLLAAGEATHEAHARHVPALRRYAVRSHQRVQYAWAAAEGAGGGTAANGRAHHTLAAAQLVVVAVCVKVPLARGGGGYDRCLAKVMCFKHSTHCS